MRAVVFMLALVVFVVARAGGAQPLSAIGAAPEQQAYALSSEQLGLLESWLKEHRWRRNLATPPVAGFRVAIKHADGTTQTVEFFDQAGWAGAVLLDGRITSSSPEEIASLREKLARDDEAVSAELSRAPSTQ